MEHSKLLMGAEVMEHQRLMDKKISSSDSVYLHGRGKFDTFLFCFNLEIFGIKA